MGAKVESRPDYRYQQRRLSALALRLQAIREQIEAAAARGETSALNREEPERKPADAVSDDPDRR
jgi:hypothetical protein